MLSVSPPNEECHRRGRLFSGRTLEHPLDQEWPVASVLALIRKSLPVRQRTLLTFVAYMC
jgi:hypothetical protein